MNDMDEVRLTIAEHPHTLDDGDVDRYVSLFKEDARLTAGTPSTRAETPSVGSSPGISTIRSWSANETPVWQFGHRDGRRTGRSVSDVMVYGRLNERSMGPATLTRHVDTLMRDGNRWSFAAKEIQRR